MFENFKARRLAAKQKQEQGQARQRAATAMAEWQSQYDVVNAMIQLASGPGFAPDGFIMHRGETCFGSLANCALVEERKGAGHYAGGNAGVSIPVGKIGNYPIRYHVGATRGHYVQGTPTPTAIGTGTMYITDQRIVFLGTTQTRECAFDKMLGADQDDEAGTLTVSVSNRQHPTVISYGSQMAEWVRFHLSVSLAHYHGTTDELMTQLNEQLATINAAKPASA
jgi:hypothetical protein